VIGAPFFSLTRNVICEFRCSGERTTASDRGRFRWFYAGVE
jgi:hypothetical protein